MNIAEIAISRRTTKAFDPARKLPADVVEQIEPAEGFWDRYMTAAA